MVQSKKGWNKMVNTEWNVQRKDGEIWVTIAFQCVSEEAARGCKENLEQKNPKGEYRIVRITTTKEIVS